MFIGFQCNKLCGDGEQSRKVTCFRKENGRITVLSDEECIVEKPDTKQSCMLRPCEGVDYITSSWSGVSLDLLISMLTMV